MKNRLYVLTRCDLDFISPMYPAVQGAHALAKFALEYPELYRQWGNEYLIMLEVKNEAELLGWALKLDNSNIEYSIFQEPDQCNEHTALAVKCDGELFKNLSLLGANMRPYKQ